jgi:hypothetical protein
LETYSFLFFATSSLGGFSLCHYGFFPDYFYALEAADKSLAVRIENNGLYRYKLECNECLIELYVRLCEFMSGLSYKEFMNMSMIDIKHILSASKKISDKRNRDNKVK